MAGNTRDETIKYQFDAKQTGIDETAKSLGDVEKKSHDAGTAFEFLKEHLAAIVSVAAAVELALKGIEFGKDSLKNAEAVEASLSRVRALAAGAAEQFDGMGQAIEQAARAVNVTSATAASGLAALASNGLSAGDAIAALTATLQLAKIANVDVGTAAAEVAQTLKAFNVPASDAQKVVDQLTSASHGAAGGLAAMSAAAAQLAPDAKALGLGFTDVVSVLGLLSSKGLDTEKAVRGLRTIFQELENPTSKLREQLLALGDGTGDFDKAIAALGQNTPRAHEALLTLNGSSRTLVELLGQAGPGALAKFNAGLQQTQGAAALAAKTIDDNLNGASTRFGLAIEQIGEKLAKPILSPFKDELEKLAGELNKFADSPDFADIEKEVGEMAKNTAAAIDQLIHGIDWKTFLTDGKDALGQIGGKLKELADSASTLASAINKTFETLGAVYHGAATGIDLVVAGAAKAADAAVSLGESVGSIGSSAEAAAADTERLHSALESIGDSAVEQAVNNTEKLGDNVHALADAEGRAAVATKAHGTAAADAAPKVAELDNAVAESSVHAEKLVTVLPTMTVNLGQSGIAAETFAEKLRDASNSAKTLEGDVKTAFDTLKLSSQQDLQNAALAAANAFALIDKSAANTAAGLIDRKNAFLVYAQAALAASAGLDEGTKASVKADLEARAGVLELSAALKILETQSSETGNALLDQAKKAEDAATRERIAREVAGAAAFNAGVQAEIAGKAAAAATDAAEKGFTEWGDAADAAALATQQITADTSHANDGMAALTQGIANARTEFLGVSEAAAKAYDTILKGAFDLGHSDDGSGFDRVARAMQTALDQVGKDIANQREQLKEEIASLNDVGTESVAAFSKFGGAVQYTNERLQNTIDSIKAGTYNAGLLGQQDLGPLLTALEAAKARVDALDAATKQATQQLIDLGQQLQDERDQQNGDLTSIENRRFEKQVEQIKELADKADAAGKAQAQKDLELAEQLHQKKLKDIADEQAAQGGSGGGSGGGSSGGGGGRGGSSPSPAGGGASGGSGSGGTGAPLPQQPQTIINNVHIHAEGALFANSDKAALGKIFVDIVLPEMKRQQSLSVKPILGP
jgi:TP901 family phage tail tape measure protein